MGFSFGLFGSSFVLLLLPLAQLVQDSAHQLLVLGLGHLLDLLVDEQIPVEHPLPENLAHVVRRFILEGQAQGQDLLACGQQGLVGKVKEHEWACHFEHTMLVLLEKLATNFAPELIHCLLFEAGVRPMVILEQFGQLDLVDAIFHSLAQPLSVLDFPDDVVEGQHHAELFYFVMELLVQRVVVEVLVLVQEHGLHDLFFFLHYSDLLPEDVLLLLVADVLLQYLNQVDISPQTPKTLKPTRGHQVVEVSQDLPQLHNAPVNLPLPVLVVKQIPMADVLVVGPGGGGVFTQGQPKVHSVEQLPYFQALPDDLVLLRVGAVEHVIGVDGVGEAALEPGEGEQVEVVVVAPGVGENAPVHHKRLPALILQLRRVDPLIQGRSLVLCFWRRHVLPGPVEQLLVQFVFLGLLLLGGGCSLAPGAPRRQHSLLCHYLYFILAICWFYQNLITISMFTRKQLHTNCKTKVHEPSFLCQGCAYPIIIFAINPKGMDPQDITQFGRQGHIDYLMALEDSKDLHSIGKYLTEHLKIAGGYWSLTSLAALKHPVSQDKMDKLVLWLKTCQNSDGGFGGNAGHDSHILSTHYAILILIGFDRLHEIDTKAVVGYVSGLQKEDGSFMGDKWGEVDTRFSYCGVSCLKLLKSLHLINILKAAEYVLKCRNFDGSFGGIPDAESHAAYVFCCVGTLKIIGYGESYDQEQLAKWLCQRQTSKGGFNGRPEKLPDVCYSWWIYSTLCMIEKEDWIDQAKLEEYILNCQDSDGGISDRPGNTSDVFHTFFGLAALSLLNPQKYDLEPIDPTYAISKKRLAAHQAL